MTKAEHTLRIISILLFVDSRLNKIEILGKELPVISSSKDFLRSFEIVGFDIKSFNSSDSSKMFDKDNSGALSYDEIKEVLCFDS